MKILKHTANIFFNKQCNLKSLAPTYAKINVSNTSPALLHSGKIVQKIVVESDTDFTHSYN